MERNSEPVFYSRFLSSSSHDQLSTLILPGRRRQNNSSMCCILNKKVTLHHDSHSVFFSLPQVWRGVSITQAWKLPCFSIIYTKIPSLKQHSWTISHLEKVRIFTPIFSGTWTDPHTYSQSFGGKFVKVTLKTLGESPVWNTVEILAQFIRMT